MEGRHCMLVIRNRAKSRLNLVLHGTEVNVVKALTVRRVKRLKLLRGTYVVEAWLADGRIGIDAKDIPHLSVEKITSRKDVSFRGRKIVADFVNPHARLDIFRENSTSELIQSN